MSALAVACLVVPEGDGRRSHEQGRDRVGDRAVLRRDPHQAVLHDPVGHVLLAQRAPDLADLLHLEAAVLGDDQGRAAAQLGTQVLDHLALGLGRHRASLTSLLRRAAGARRWVRPGDAGLNPCDGPRGDAGGATHPEVGRWPLPRRARRRPRPSPSRVGGRSGPADQAPGVIRASRPVTRPAGAGCLRRSVSLCPAIRSSAAWRRAPRCARSVRSRGARTPPCSDRLSGLMVPSRPERRRGRRGCRRGRRGPSSWRW